MGDRSARIDAWLEEVFGDASAIMLRPNQLVALNLAAQRGAVPPDEVMEIWLHAMFSARIMAAQSEPERLDQHRDEQVNLYRKIHPAIRLRKE